MFSAKRRRQCRVASAVAVTFLLFVSLQGIGLSFADEFKLSVAHAGVTDESPARTDSVPASHAYVMPDLQARTNTSGRRRPLGMEGWGQSVINIQNLGAQTNGVRYSFAPIHGRNVVGAVELAGGGSSTLSLQELPGAISSFYSGRLTADEPVGLLAYTEWTAGGAVGYEAPEFTDGEIVLPLVARQMADYSTTYMIANYALANEPAGANEIVANVYDPLTGEPTLRFSEALMPGDIIHHNVDHLPVFQSLPANRLGGFVGALFLDPAAPVAVVAYGEDATGASTSAYLARPSAAADRVQLLPVVRSGIEGDSLIAVTNVTETSAEVTIEYTALPQSADVPGKSQRQRLEIPGRATRFVDLGELGRGGVDGDVPERPFVGSALIESSEPILAVVQDHQGLGRSAKSAAAYNAFGLADMASAVGIPRITHSGQRSTDLFISSPDAFATFEVTYLAGDTPVGSIGGRVQPGAAAQVTPADAGIPPGQALRAIVTSSSPVAVVARESGVTGPAGAVDAAIWAGFPLEAAATSPSPTPTLRPTDPPEPTVTVDPTATSTVDPTAVPSRSVGEENQATIYLPTAANGTIRE